jgi:Ca2+-dependent lipid-binding protein
MRRKAVAQYVHGDDQNEEGIMCLVVHEAKLYRDTESFGQMDPFVEMITSDGMKYRTRVLQDAGK